MSPTPALWLSRSTDKQRGEWNQVLAPPILISPLKQVLEEERLYPTSFYYHSPPGGVKLLWVNCHSQHSPGRLPGRPMTLDWPPSDHPKPLARLPAQPACPGSKIGFHNPWVVPQALSQLEGSFLMLLTFSSANPRPNTGFQPHFLDLGVLPCISYPLSFWQKQNCTA